MTTVLLLEDHPQVRKQMSALLESAKSIEVIGAVSTVRAARHQLAENGPDLLVTDLSLPDGEGTELIREVRDRWPALPVLVVSMHEPAIYGPKARKAGADGYLHKIDAAGELVEAARTVAGRGTSWSEAIREAGSSDL